MRLGMRSYTIGSAWWQGDCGPYWGHNAIVRMAPFTACCDLPVIEQGAPVKGHVLSHDQIEAVLMRRAGYEVRVLAEEGSSFEQNPPTLLEFIRRDLRWCQGNMQYWHFLRAPGLQPVSRYQLLLAILMFLGSPAWMGLLLLGSTAAAIAPNAGGFHALGCRDCAFVARAGNVVCAQYRDRHRRAQPCEARRAFGGGPRFTASFAITVVFVLLLAPIMWVGHTLFLARLLLGRTIGWGAQARDDHVVPWSLALRRLWPQTLIGLAPILLLAVTAPSAIPYALFIAGGTAALDPARCCDRLARTGARTHSGRHRSPARGGRRRRPCWSRSSCPRSRCRGARDKAACLALRCSTLGGPCAASFGRCGFITAMATGAPPCICSIAASSSRATSFSTSAPMWATAIAAFRRLARGSSRSSRSPP